MARPSEQRVVQLFAQVSEALARATWALLNADAELERTLWSQVAAITGEANELRHLVGTLLVLPELERSADLAERVARRGVAGLGGEMTPVSRGIVQRMSEVAIDMWRQATEAYARGDTQGLDLDETDEELDILHDRPTTEVSTGSMQPSVAAQVTLIARFYERLGDHAVNVTRRITTFED